MKLIPLNGVNIWQLVFVNFVPQTDVFNAFFNFWTIYQVGGVQYVLVSNNTVTF